jgi:ferredoxin
VPDKSSSFDIFDLLSGSEEKVDKEKGEQKKQRDQLLAPTCVKDIFPEGTISVDMRTCIGVQCKLCIKVCPTNALFWQSSGVGIINDLCVHCGACVLVCMVDNCIKVTRKREDGTEEKFSKASDVLALTNGVNAKKRFGRVHEVFPTSAEYSKKYGFQK